MKQNVYKHQRIYKSDMSLPELRFCANLVGGPKLHAVNLRVLICLRWESPPNDLVLVKLQNTNKQHTMKIFTIV